MRVSEEEMREMKREDARLEALRPPLSPERIARLKASVNAIAEAMCENIRNSNPNNGEKA